MYILLKNKKRNTEQNNWFKYWIMKVKLMDEKFKILLNSLPTSKIKEIISEYNKDCIKSGQKENKLRGYSKYRKSELINFFIPVLSDDEKDQYYTNIEPKFIKTLISQALSLLLGDDKRETIANVEKIPEKDGYKLKINGFNWDVATSVSLEENELFYVCDCRIGKSGFCVHHMAASLMLLSENKMELKDFPLDFDDSMLEGIKGKLKMINNKKRADDEADIIFRDKYKIFVSGSIITTKWEGEYQGSKTIDASLEEGGAENWIAKKVVDKILKHMKVKAKTGKPTLLEKDSYAIISKIMVRPKLVTKILKKFLAVDPSLPADEKTLYDFLRKDLEIDHNPEFEEIESNLNLK